MKNEKIEKTVFDQLDDFLIRNVERQPNKTVFTISKKYVHDGKIVAELVGQVSLVFKREKDVEYCPACGEPVEDWDTHEC